MKTKIRIIVFLCLLFIGFLVFIQYTKTEINLNYNSSLTKRHLGGGWIAMSPPQIDYSPGNISMIHKGDLISVCNIELPNPNRQVIAQNIKDTLFVKTTGTNNLSVVTQLLKLPVHLGLDFEHQNIGSIEITADELVIQSFNLLSLNKARNLLSKECKRTISDNWSGISKENPFWVLSVAYWVNPEIIVKDDKGAKLKVLTKSKATKKFTLEHLSGALGDFYFKIEGNFAFAIRPWKLQKRITSLGTLNIEVIPAEEENRFSDKEIQQFFGEAFPK